MKKGEPLNAMRLLMLCSKVYSYESTDMVCTVYNWLS